MTLDVQAIGAAMIEAARASAGRRWPELQMLAEVELRLLAQSLAEVAGLLATGQIEETRARHLVHMHEVAVRGVLISIKGITLLAAERTIQAAVRAAAQAINGVAKLALL